MGGRSAHGGLGLRIQGGGGSQPGGLVTDDNAGDGVADRREPGAHSARSSKSAKRLLKKIRRKESRRTKDLNHRISKTIVTEAERTGRGISLEELKGIRERVRLRKPGGYLPRARSAQWGRVALHTWAFAQLGDFIVYKARRAGVPLVFVDPAYSSQECAQCGHTDRLNRITQARFTCRGCGVVAHADRNSSHVLARRGQAVWNAGRKSHVPATRPQF
jgi:putative transposase